MKNYFMLAIVGCALLFAAGCSKKDESAVVLGTLRGTVKSANGIKPIKNALVYADARSSGYSTRTGITGKFELMAPSGTHTLFIETGDGSIFQTQITVDVQANQTVDLPAAQTILKLHGSLAFIAGPYDKIESVVRDTLGYTITEIFDYQLNDLNYLQTFDGIFINCGASIQPGDTAAFNNLAAFVSLGGSLYASDFGLDFFMGPYDGTCTPAGGFIDDSKLCVNRGGSTGVVPSADVINTGLQAALGTATIDLGYDLAGWNMVAQYDNNYFDAWINNTATGPLLLYTNQYNNGQGTAPGNIYWTSFHNLYNATGSNTSEHILEYVILNL